jgi:cytochrome c-type biogenesis protein CcmH
MMRLCSFILLSLLVIGAHGVALAVQPDEILRDPQLEQRARDVSQNLRCLVCQNQSIDDSDADLAHDLRVLVRQRLQAGDTDAQVKKYVVDRYGDYVLLKPPFKSTTLFLWFGPAAMLLIAALMVVSFYRRRTNNDPSKPLSKDEQQRLRELIGEKPKTRNAP